MRCSAQSCAGMDRHSTEPFGQYITSPQQSREVHRMGEV